MQGCCFLSSPSQLNKNDHNGGGDGKVLSNNPYTSDFLPKHLFFFLLACNVLFLFAVMLWLLKKTSSCRVVKQAWILESIFARAALHPLFSFSPGEPSRSYLAPSPCIKGIWESPVRGGRWPEGPLANSFWPWYLLGVRDPSSAIAVAHCGQAFSASKSYCGSKWFVWVEPDVRSFSTGTSHVFSFKSALLKEYLYVLGKSWYFFCILFSCKGQGASMQWEIITVLLKFMSSSAHVWIHQQ